jgi:2-enoate reductase
VFATDLLLAPSLADGCRDIVIVGGGDVGCETAHMLATEYHKNVTVIEASPHFMQASCTANRGYLIHYLERLGVTLWNASRIARIGDVDVEVVRNLSRSVPSPYAVWQPLLPENVRNPFAREIEVEEQRVSLATDLVVFATGLQSNGTLYQACVAARVAPEIHNIGDSFRVGRIFDATKAAYAIGSAV